MIGFLCRLSFKIEDLFKRLIRIVLNILFVMLSPVWIAPIFIFVFCDSLWKKNKDAYKVLKGEKYLWE